MEYDDDELLDRMAPEYEPPTHPLGLQFQIDEADLKKAAGEDGKPGDTLRFSSMAEVTSIYRGEEGSRIELELRLFAGEDGDFFELTRTGCICFCAPELEKLDLDDDCELGDLIHLIGEARLVSVSNHPMMGDIACLQITDLTYAEDESTESREG